MMDLADRIITNDKLLVHYSVVLSDKDRLAHLLRQLAVSLTTLRVRNPETPVVIFCHGTVPDVLARLAAHHRAEIVEQPEYVHRLRAHLGSLGAAFEHYLPLQKFLNFEQLAQLPQQHVLYLDCDTVVTGDLVELVRRYDANVVAREEVGSERCIHGGDPAYLDEAQLRHTALTTAEFAPAPAMNTGVVLFNNLPRAQARRLEAGFCRWALRFAVWMAMHPPRTDAREYGDVVDCDLLQRHLASPDGRRLGALAVPYPSINRWIIEEVAIWMALGELGNLTFDCFAPAAVAQAGEPLAGRLPTAIWHYFSSNQQAMEDRLGLQAARA